MGQAEPTGGTHGTESMMVLGYQLSENGDTAGILLFVCDAGEWSRKVIAWRVSRSLAGEEALGLIDQAMITREFTGCP